VQNNRNSPHDVRSSDCRVLIQTYSLNVFSSRFWRAVVSFTAGEKLGQSDDLIYEIFFFTFERYICISLTYLQTSCHLEIVYFFFFSALLITIFWQCHNTVSHCFLWEINKYCIFSFHFYIT